MALTAAEKMRRRRQKLKDEGKYEEYKAKHRETARQSRAKKKIEVDRMTAKEREKVRREERKRSRESVAKSRLNKKLKESQAKSTPYKSPSSLGKAIARVKRSLPKSPRKKQVVVQHLIQNTVPSNQRNVPVKNRSGKDPVSNDTVQMIQEFFVRDDISRQAPGMKDVTTVRSSDGKHKEQIRHLYNSILETFSLFCSEHPNIKVGKSKFAELRPKHVFLSSKMPHNVCLCKLHENFISAMDSFKKCCSEFPPYSATFLNSFLCKNATEKCWKNTCDKCENLLEDCVLNLIATSTTSTIEWYKWKKCEGKLTKVVEEGSIEDLARYIVSLKEEFFSHCFVKREQASSYQLQKEQVGPKNTNPTMALLQVDFAENYTCVAQDEIQSFHWVQPQVSIFTISLWFNGKHFPAVIVSDELDHTKFSIIPYLEKVLEELPKEIKLVNIWSDGPSSQFKNRYIAAVLPIFESKFKRKFVWNFFATSHGKGPVDGIGGAIKRQVRNYVKARKGTVFNAQDFATAARAMKTDVKIIEMEKNEIDERNESLNIHSVCEEATALDNITKMHCIYVINGIVNGSNLTKEKEKIVTSEENQMKSHKISNKSIILGTFLLIKVLGKKRVFQYVAISQSGVEDDEIRVMFLKKKNTDNTIFVPDENDVSYVSIENVVKILPDASIKQNGSRLFYEFQEKIDVCERN